jgi:hypothetical protein
VEKTVFVKNSFFSSCHFFGPKGQVFGIFGETTHGEACNGFCVGHTFNCFAMATWLNVQ